MRYETVPSLAAVYEAEGLPPAMPPGELPPGERRALAEHGVGAFVERIHAAQHLIMPKRPPGPEASAGPDTRR